VKTPVVENRTRPLPDERQLVEQAKSGDTEAFAQLYDASMARVYRYVFFRVSDQQTAEDLTSQVFLKAWEKLDSYRPKGPFLSWLYAIARNTVIDHYRTQKQTVSLEDAGPLVADIDGLEDVMEFHFEMKSVQAAMQQLTGEQQEVLILRFIADYDTDEIARRMDKSQGAVRALQMRALQALAKVIDVNEQ